MRLKIVTLLYIISSNFCFPDLFSDIGSPDDNLTIFGARPIYTNGGKTNVIVDDKNPLDLGLNARYLPKPKEDLLELDEDELKVEDWQKKTAIEKEKLQHEKD